MKTENIYCDFCLKQTTENGKVKEKLNGFCIEIGYSRGGWGSRENFFPSKSVEICDGCFEIMKQKSQEFLDTIDKLHPFKK